MYKSRFKLWIFILIAYIGVTILAPILGNGIKEYNEKPAQVTLYSTNNQIKKQFDNRSIGKTKFIINSKNADITISQGILDKDDYKNVAFYSPLVIIMENSYGVDSLFETINSTGSYTIKGIDLKKLTNCFINDLTYKEGYSTKEGDIKNHKVALYLDSNYEKEIKYLLLTSFANTLNVTQEDIEKYGEQVEFIWNKAEKIDNIPSFLNEKPVKDFVLITPEYNISVDNSTLRIMSLGDTVSIDFTVSYKEEYENIVNDESFMKISGLRNANYVGSYHKGNMSTADWTINYISNSDIDDFSLNIYTNIEVPQTSINNSESQTILNENSNADIMENTETKNSEDTQIEEDEQNSSNEENMEEENTQSIENNDDTQNEDDSNAGLLLLLLLLLVIFEVGVIIIFILS